MTKEEKMDWEVIATGSAELLSSAATEMNLLLGKVSIFGSTLDIADKIAYYAAKLKTALYELAKEEL